MHSGSSHLKPALGRFHIFRYIAAAAVTLSCSDGGGPPTDPDPTDNRIAFISDGNVASMREDGSNRALLIRDEIGPYDGASGPLSWSPDGTLLLVKLTRHGPGGIGEIAAVVAGNGSGYRNVAEVVDWGLGVGSWSPDGTRIAYYKATTSHLGSTALYTANADGTGETRLITDPNPSPGGHHDWTPVWSPNGTEIAFVSDRTVPGVPEFRLHLFAVDVSGGQARQLLPEEVIEFYFDWAPDGQRLAILLGPERVNETTTFSNIYAVDRDGTGAVRLSQDNVDAGPVWSPDGGRVAFQSIRDGNPELYLMNADGTGVQRLTNDTAADANPAWSPDGSHLAFQTNRDGNWEIYSIAVDGTGLTNLTQSPSQETTPAWR